MVVRGGGHLRFIAHLHPLLHAGQAPDDGRATIRRRDRGRRRISEAEAAPHPLRRLPRRLLLRLLLEWCRGILQGGNRNLEVERGALCRLLLLEQGAPSLEVPGAQLLGGQQLLEYWKHRLRILSKAFGERLCKVTEVRNGRVVGLVQLGGKRNLFEDAVSLGVSQLGAQILQHRAQWWGGGPILLRLAHRGHRTQRLLNARGHRDGGRSLARHGLHATPLGPVPVQAAPPCHFFDSVHDEGVRLVSRPPRTISNVLTSTKNGTCACTCAWLSVVAMTPK